MTMRRAVISFCLLTLCYSFANSLNLKNLKHRAGHGGRKSVVIHTVNPVQRSAWECHPGCKRFCLSSCKRSCCMPGAPNYNPSMFNQLVSYQSSLPAPPPPPPGCPVGCPGSCYPSCDSGCCFQASQPSFPQYPSNPYDVGYVGYPAGDPCATQGCSASCAPLCKPDCCRSQALNLSIRPVYLGGKASPAPAPKPPPKKPVKAYHKKKPVHKKPASKIGIVCIPACQTLCKPVCDFECCLPTHKFHKQSDHKTSHPKPHKPTKVHLDIKPVASVQKVPIPKLFALPAPTEDAAAQQDSQQSPYAGYPYQDAALAAAPVTPTAGITCPGSCPLACAPSCQWSCCSPFLPQPALSAPQPALSAPQPALSVPQPLPYGAVQDNPMDASTRTASPGLVPMQTSLNSCPAPSCPDTCAPLCSRSCCAGIKLLPQSWDKRNKIPGRL